MDLIGVAGLVVGIWGFAFGLYAYVQGARTLGTAVDKLLSETNHLRRGNRVLLKELERAGVISIRWGPGGEPMEIVYASASVTLPALQASGTGKVSDSRERQSSPSEGNAP